MMISKIISGGQTGANQAALDVAIKLGIPYGGWIAKGRKTENGRLPEKYRLQEMPTASPGKHAEQNVLESDGTLILSHGKLTGGAEYTRKMAMHHGRTWLHLDLNRTIAFKAAKTVRTWVRSHAIEILNVAGPRASKDPEIYQDTVNILETAFYIDLIDMSIPRPFSLSAESLGTVEEGDLPRTVDQAVRRLISHLSLRDKAKIARSKEQEVVSLYFSLGEYIRDTFGLSWENRELLDSCRAASGTTDLYEDDASAVIIDELLKKLRESHTLRVLR
jgi:hypothetical protein